MNLNFGRIILTSLLCSVAIFMFGFVYWAMIPAPEWALKSIPKEKLAAFNIAAQSLESGTYISPGPQPMPGETAEEHLARMKAGPIVVISLDADGGDMPDTKGLAEGFAHGWLAAILMAILLSMAAPALCTFKSRFCFVFLAGFFASFWSEIGDSIWWHRSCGSTTWYMLYDVGAWLLAAVILATLIRAPTKNEKKEGGG